MMNLSLAPKDSSLGVAIIKITSKRSTYMLMFLQTLPLSSTLTFRPPGISMRAIRLPTSFHHLLYQMETMKVRST